MFEFTMGILIIIFIIWLIYMGRKSPKVYEHDNIVKSDGDPNIVKCPKCGSNNIQVVKRGWKITTGFLGSGRNERVCVNCMKRF